MTVFISDVEGPITKNDNAYELTCHYLKGPGIDGGRVFSVISSYDDVLAYVFKKEGYKAGDTLRLILPFLKAFGATNAEIEEYSRANLLLMPGIKQALKEVQDTHKIPSYIISTSYEPYVKALCRAIGFPFEYAYCTHLNIDRYNISPAETLRLKKIAVEISSMEVIKIPEKASNIRSFRKKDQEAIKRLDEIFWEELTGLEIYSLIEDVNPVGGREKSDATADIIKKLDKCITEVIYFGDSITDVETLRMVRKGGGLAVSFNGNAYAIHEADIAVMATETWIIALLTEAFDRHGKEGVIDLISSFNKGKRVEVGSELLATREMRKKGLYGLYVIDEKNMHEIITESTALRRSVRGEKIGELG
ncbi:MAG: hypothetical protein QW390_01945 [Candidatus Bathyarchaeia archaeon]